MRILLTGADGGLGRALTACLAERYELLPLFHKQADVADISSLKDYFLNFKPAVVFHLAALTDIELCEKNPELALEVNVKGTRNVVELSQKTGVRHIVFTSSPFIFDGKKQEAYVESDPPCPINIYGKTKLMAEAVVKSARLDFTILRPGWLFGPFTRGFFPKLVGVLTSDGEVHLATNSFFSPVYTVDIARYLTDFITHPDYGVIHISSGESITPYDFGCEILRLTGWKAKIFPATFESLKFSVPRPKNFAIRSERGVRLPDFRKGLESFLKAWNLKLLGSR